MEDGFPWWILIVVVFGGIFVYVLFMIFLPEWVGITGKTALKNEQEHRGDESTTAGEAPGSGSAKPPNDRPKP